MLCDFPEESKKNTCVLFSGYWHFKGFTSCFHQLLRKVMKLGEFLLSSQEGHPGISFWALQAPLTSFCFGVFTFFTLSPLVLAVSHSCWKVHPAFSFRDHSYCHTLFDDMSQLKERMFWTAGQLKAGKRELNGREVKEGTFTQ